MGLARPCWRRRSSRGALQFTLDAGDVAVIARDARLEFGHTVGVLLVVAGFIAALVIGLTPDERWDAQHNAMSGRQSDSGWAVILIVIATFSIGTTLLIAAIARFFDLLYTGGAYG